MNKKRNTWTWLGMAAGIGILGISFLVFSANTNSPSDLDPTLSEAEASIEYRFGLPTSSYDLEEHQIKSNENLSDILQRYQIGMTDITLLAERSKDVFDVRKIAAGNKYTVFKNSEGRAEYFVYQPNLVNYIVYELVGEKQVYEGKKEVVSEMKAVTGIIENSLYTALQQQGANPDLATQLAEIYGWTVNFHRIQKGDWFKIQYENKTVKGESVGTGRIVSAIFSHQGKEYQAYHFQSSDTAKGTYYDENGNTMRRMFLRAPIKYTRISSRFSPRRLHPVQKVWRPHLGTDFAAPHGTPIVATADGMVIASMYHGGNGNYVKIQHDNVYATQYLHMSKRAVNRGERVRQGQVIGYVGSTGLATGPHVCYRFWKNGKQVDALAQHFPPAEPIAKQHKMAFNSVIAQYRQVFASLDPNNPTGTTKYQEIYSLDLEKLFSNNQEVKLEESRSRML